MKKIRRRLVSFFFSKILTIETTKKLVQKICAIVGIDMLDLAYDAKGILKYQDLFVSGEEYFLSKILLEYFKKFQVNTPVIFDVGANTGEYSLLINKMFPTAQVYGFEPNPVTFKTLSEKVKHLDNVKVFNIGLGSKIEDASIFSYKSDVESQHASLYKDVLVDFHKVKEVVELKIKINTIEQFCVEHTINKIDFLKVDTEGFELEVFKGALKIINDKKIDFIQFEFNEMNIISKVFLKDFYLILNGYKFYRLDSKKVIPLYQYNPINEIFRFHNIIAVKEDIIISNS